MMKKTIFCAPETAFLGHRVTSEGLSADSGKIEAIVKLKTPTSVLDKGWVVWLII